MRPWLILAMLAQRTDLALPRGTPRGNGNPAVARAAADSSRARASRRGPAELRRDDPAQRAPEGGRLYGGEDALRHRQHAHRCGAAPRPLARRRPAMARGSVGRMVRARLALAWHRAPPQPFLRPRHRFAAARALPHL